LITAGRDWKACAAHVRTRDARSFASHAQKHFIKLCINGKQLPDKVAESGPGYTLSGKLLDPESSAAKAYGFKLESLLSML
jgi:protein MYSM1